MRIATAYSRRAATAALVVLLTVSTAPQPALGAPSTPEIEAKQAEAAAAQAELDRMNTALEVQVEEYNAITDALEQTRQEIIVTRADLERAERELAEATSTLSDRATTIYKAGRVGVIDIFVGATSFEDFMVRLDLAVRISEQDAKMVARVKEAKAEVETTEIALEQRQAEQVALQSESGARAAAIQADVQAQETFVSQMNGEVREMIAAEEARQAELAAERARQAAAAAAARGSGSTGGRTATDPGSLGTSDSSVVAIALQYLGVPYVWGGSSPTGFDCSGLVVYVYRQVGVTLPRTSQSQYRFGQHIAPDRLDLLQPGDLVFFGTDGNGDQVHHVGIYVGDGNYIHAPYTGAVVRVDSLTARIASKRDYVGASRI